jgi:alpha-amylase
MRDLFGLSDAFGGADGLHALMQAARKSGVAVMLDIVGNHVGPDDGDGSFPAVFSPFNSTDHYHGTPQSHCSAGGTDQQKLETCWLVNLPDLKQENPFVTEQFVAWMSGLQTTFGFDGIRIDTVP